MADRNELKKSLAKRKTQLLNLCNDKKFANKLLEDILFYKDEMGVEPTIVNVPATKIVGEIKNSAYNIVQTQTHIVYSVNGFSCIITPAMQIFRVYQQLIFQKNLLIFSELDLSLYDTKEKIEASDLTLGVKDMLNAIVKGELTKDILLSAIETDLYKGLLEHCCLIPYGIALTFENPIFMNQIYNFILDNIEAMIAEASNPDNLQVDDPMALFEAKNDEDLIDSLKSKTL